jgi:hypothetical protein
MGKCSNAFFSETTNIIKAKLYMNVHWMVLYKFYVFYSDMKFKMAATAGLSLTLEPKGKMFQNASSLKPLGQLKPSCPGMIIGRSSTRCVFLSLRSVLCMFVCLRTVCCVCSFDFVLCVVYVCLSSYCIVYVCLSKQT